MIDLTPTARQTLDSYLLRVRAALRGKPASEADDVEQSVREHIEIALASSEAPVGADQLVSILDRLGLPEGWVPDYEQPAWQRIINRLRTGPEDWRLAYVAFGVFVLSVLTIPAGIGVLLLLPAYLLSRAYIDFMALQGEELGARRWLVYPPIAILLAFALILAVVGPAGPVAAWGIGEHGFHRAMGLYDRHHGGTVIHTRFDIGSVAVVFGSWWIIAALLLSLFLPFLRFIFRPLL
ncbi:MAG: hypothetical protein ABI718_18760, partial [Acidobacteriota bacterium]